MYVNPVRAVARAHKVETSWTRCYFL